MKYVAMVSYCGQVSPDDWTTVMEHLEVTPETTVQQIVDWMKSFDQKQIRHFSVREVDQIKSRESTGV